MTALLLAEHDAGELAGATARAVAAASRLGQPIDLLVVGGDASIAEAAAQLDGVGKVLVAYSMDHHAESLAGFLLGIGDNYSHIAAASSAIGRDVIPRLAAKLDLMPVTDVIHRTLGGISTTETPDGVKFRTSDGMLIAFLSRIDDGASPVELVGLVPSGGAPEGGGQ